ncbi:MAG: YbgC/FadM family acyl-CoA thioesterase [Chitinispirillaceae bacterium]|nr:YbgC/FadM family acyl-CoA thioesterase [Chitinispirillaceae bacterium]
MLIRVYYEDTDCGNVVYYANYLRYMERSRTEFMRDLGLDLGELHQKGIMFVVTEVNVKYRLPARYNDLLDVQSSVIDVTSVCVTFKTDIFRYHGPILVSGTVKLACVNKEGRLCRAPEEITSLLKKCVISSA